MPLKSALNSFSSFFIHPENRKDRVLLITSNILFAVIFAFFLFLVFYSTYFIVNGVFDSFKAWLNYTGVFTLAFALSSLKYNPNTKTSLSIMGFMGFLFITGGVYEAGGIESNDLYWYVVLIVSNILFVRDMQTIVIVVLSLLAITGFYLMHTYWNVQLPIDEVAGSIHYKFFNVLFITFMLSFMGLLLVKGNKQLQKAIAQLKEADIREELAIDFHDRIGNKLASIKQLVYLTKHSEDPQLSEEALNQIEEFSSTIYDDFKDFLWAQKEEHSYLDELVNYLKDFIENYLKLSPIKFYVDLSPQQLPHLPIGFVYTKEIIPIIKETVTNSYKHSQAEKLTFRVFVSSQEVVMKIEDDGIGFEENSRAEGNGLYNIKKRTSRLPDAQVNIKTSSKGTTMAIQFSMKDMISHGN